jgi:hypothetical protein
MSRTVNEICNKFADLVIILLSIHRNFKNIFPFFSFKKRRAGGREDLTFSETKENDGAV